MKCPHCGGEHPASYKFCPVTGKEIDAHHGMKACSNPECPDCGKYILPAEAKFCPRCGRPISDYGKAVESVRSCDSRIVIVCSGTAYIKVGEERDKKIRLKEGENVISVNDYPELKYGFSMENNPIMWTEGLPQHISRINLSDYDTSEITDMSMMFLGCSSLVSLDLSGFDTSQVTDMGWMFCGCSSLESLDLSGFDTSQVTDMGSMFHGCSSLWALDLSGFDTSRVTKMGSMFYGCSSLKSLDLSSFYTYCVTDMGWMFHDCSSLVSLDLSGFDTSRVKNRFMMFYGCPKSIQEKYKNFK